MDENNRMGGDREMTCEYCGEPHHKREGTKFCSDTCRYRARLEPKTCKYCETTFDKHGRSKFCCDECRIKFFNDKKKLNNNPIIKRACKVCGAEIITSTNKVFCGKECRQLSQQNEQKEIRSKNTEIFRKMAFKEFVSKEGDDIDFPMKDLALYKYCDVKLKDHLRYYGITPRLKKVETDTLRGVWRRKITIVNVNELIELYNIKIEKFRNYPHLNVKNTIIDIGNMINLARRKLNEKNIVVLV